MNEPHVYSDDERRLTLISVMIVFLLSAMSQTIVGTAMPRIIAELSGLHLYAWATTAYLLASTVMVPIWGKLGDLYGRKPILLIGIGIFLAGSWLAGLAGEFGDLALLGGVQLALPCLMVVRLSRQLAAPEIALLGLLEVLFGISWAWLGAGETPHASTLIGGALVLAALITNEALALLGRGAQRARNGHARE